ncbi:MAG TPA: ATP synthase F1 subunit epsilon [Candidatus Andersenbacteria bacterium]|nr:ATP synthase F1 subunit epsilon [Candidatus Andersenbacteria bacterium]
MARSFTFELITPDGLKYEHEVYQVLIPTMNGTIGVLPGHEALITIVKPGVLSIYPHADLLPDTVEHLAVLGGFADISGKRVRMLADNAEYAHEIDELKAQEALANALNIQSEAKDQVAMSEAVGIIEREATRLKVAGLKRSKSSRSF